MNVANLTRAALHYLTASAINKRITGQVGHAGTAPLRRYAREVALASVGQSTLHYAFQICTSSSACAANSASIRAG